MILLWTCCWNTQGNSWHWPRTPPAPSLIALILWHAIRLRRLQTTCTSRADLLHPGALISLLLCASSSHAYVFELMWRVSVVFKCVSLVYMEGMHMVWTCAHEYLLVWVRVSQENHHLLHAHTSKIPHASPFRAHTQVRVVFPRQLTASPQSKPLSSQPKPSTGGASSTKSDTESYFHVPSPPLPPSPPLQSQVTAIKRRMFINCL